MGTHVASGLIREARREQGLLGHPLALLHGTRVAPPRSVREAIELLEAYPDRAWSAPALASQVRVSVRALQEGFQRALDTTPMRYLREVRLRRVREELLAATPDVATVVHRWGILNQGSIRRNLSKEIRRSTVGYFAQAVDDTSVS